MESLIGYINHSPISVQPQEYIFSAIAKSGTISSYVTFEEFLVNNGNAFDLSTGIFTAPVSGAFEFAFSGNTEGNSRFHQHY